MIAEAFPSPLGASHFQILSLTPRIPCGLAERFAWENQIGASFMSSASPKSPQTQHLSHARENRPFLPLSLIPHSHYNTRFIITQSLFSSTQLHQAPYTKELSNYDNDIAALMNGCCNRTGYPPRNPGANA